MHMAAGQPINNKAQQYNALRLTETYYNAVTESIIRPWNTIMMHVEFSTNSADDIEIYFTHLIIVIYNYLNEKSVLILPALRQE